MSLNNHTRLYRSIVNALEKSPLNRERLINETLGTLGIDSKNLSTANDQGLVRGKIGTIINDMHATGLIALDEDSRYYLVYAFIIDCIQ